MIKFVLLGLALSEELNVRISHGYTGYLFLSSDKSFECGLDLAQIGREACSDRGYASPEVVGGRDEYIEYVQNSKSDIKNSRFFKSLQAGNSDCVKKMIRNEICSDRRGDSDSDCKIIYNMQIGSNCPAITRNNPFFIHCGQQINQDPVPTFTVETDCSAGIETTIQSSKYICGDECQFCHFTQDFENFNQIFMRGVRPSDPDMDESALRNCTINFDYYNVTEQASTTSIPETEAQQSSALTLSQFYMYLISGALIGFVI